MERQKMQKYADSKQKEQLQKALKVLSKHYLTPYESLTEIGQYIELTCSSSEISDLPTNGWSIQYINALLEKYGIYYYGQNCTYGAQSKLFAKNNAKNNDSSVAGTISGPMFVATGKCSHFNTSSQYPVRIGDHIKYRYEILDFLGQGSFGQVVLVKDWKTNELSAIKIIKNKPKFKQQALIELEILQSIGGCSNCSFLSHHAPLLLDHFEFRQFQMFKFELLSKWNLFDYVVGKSSKSNGAKSTSSSSVTAKLGLMDIWWITGQLVGCLKDLKNVDQPQICGSSGTSEKSSFALSELLGSFEWWQQAPSVGDTPLQKKDGKPRGIIHCDLKPENILFEDSSFSAESLHLSHSLIKLIDFGSSCFEGQQVHSYIQSRFYRAPEVVFGCQSNGRSGSHPGYTRKIDIWSLGCVLVELYTGKPIFGARDEWALVRSWVEILGWPDGSVNDRDSLLFGPRSGLFLRQSSNGSWKIRSKAGHWTKSNREISNQNTLIRSNKTLHVSSNDTSLDSTLSSNTSNSSFSSSSSTLSFSTNETRKSVRNPDTSSFKITKRSTSRSTRSTNDSMGPLKSLFLRFLSGLSSSKQQKTSKDSLSSSNLNNYPIGTTSAPARNRATFRGSKSRPLEQILQFRPIEVDGWWYGFNQKQKNRRNSKSAKSAFEGQENLGTNELENTGWISWIVHGFSGRASQDMKNDPKQEISMPPVPSLKTQMARHDAFVDFCQRCLTWDPAQRISPDEAWEHEFLAGLRECHEFFEEYKSCLNSKAA